MEFARASASLRRSTVDWLAAAFLSWHKEQISHRIRLSLEGFERDLTPNPDVEFHPLYDSKTQKLKKLIYVSW